MLNNQKKPVVSVIIPSFNRENELSRAINSVIDQTYQDWELLIIDDGSTDNTRKLVEKYMNTDSRIRYIYQEKQRQVAARNNGIKQASGQYIAFLDSDDMWYPEKLQKQISVIQSNDSLAGVYTNQDLKRIAGKITCRYSPSKLGDGYILKDLLLLRYYCTPSSLLLKKNIIEEVGMFDPTYEGAGEDWPFIMKIARKYPLGCCREPLILKIEDESPHRYNNAIMYLEKLGNTRIRTLKTIVPGTNLSFVFIRKLFARDHCWAAKIYLSHSRYSKALREVIAALLSWPLRLDSYFLLLASLSRSQIAVELYEKGRGLLHLLLKKK